MNTTSGNIDFLYQLGTLRHIQRSWRQYFGADVATDLEHTMRVVFIALILAKRIGNVNEEMIMKMALVHDLAESLTGDMTPVQKKYVTINEEKAIEDMFSGTDLGEYVEILERYLKRECMESKIVKDADRLDIDLEIRELAMGGHDMSRWTKQRETVTDEFFTDEGRELQSAITNSNPGNWRDVIEAL